MAHGHDVLHMMEGNSYETKEDLVKAIIEHFGEEERFHTCSVDGMNAEELVDFLTERGKFMPAKGDSLLIQLRFVITKTVKNLR